MRIVHNNTAAPAWNAFVEKSAAASIFHLLEWRRIIARAYGHESYYLSAEEAGEIRGILPLFLIRSRLFGNSLISVPFADYGGVCSDNEQVRDILVSEALRIAKRVGADYLQLRQHDPVAGLNGVPADKVTMLLTLTEHPEKIWAVLPAERRNRIRKARRAGVTAGFFGVEALEGFFGVFAENMRDIGSPVHSRAFFRAMLEEFRTSTKILVVQHAGETIGAAVCLFFRDTLYVPWVSSLRRRFALNPNMMLYWTAIEYGCLNGYKTLDFGRSSRGSGTLEFKRQWGAELAELGWRSFPLNGSGIPTFSGKNLKERVFVECWKRLPVSLATRFGPLVRGGIPA